MLDFVVNEFEKILNQAISRFSKDFSCEQADLQIVFKLKEDGDCGYSLHRKYKFERNLKFTDLLGVKIDFKGYSIFVPPYIKSALISFSKELNCATSEVFVMAFIGNGSKINLWLYKSSNAIRTVTIEEICNQGVDA